MHKLIGMVALSAVVIVLAGSTKAGNPISHALSAAEAARQTDRPTPTVRAEATEPTRSGAIAGNAPLSQVGDLIDVPAVTPVIGTDG